MMKGLGEGRRQGRVVSPNAPIESWDVVLYRLCCVK